MIRAADATVKEYSDDAELGPILEEFCKNL